MRHVQLIVGLLGLVLSGPVWAQVPHDMTYQGQLTDSVGAPLSGPVNLQLRIFDVLSGGSTLYAEDHSGVTLDADGAFSVQLGAGAGTTGTFNAALFSGVNRYLEVVVDGEVLTPRQVLASVPWALVAEEASTVQGQDLVTQLGTLSSDLALVQSTANTALTNATTAQGTADAAVTDAATAQGTADTALTSAAAAQSAANAADAQPGPVQGADLTISEAGSAHPKSSHKLNLLGTTSAGTQRAMSLHNASTSGSAYRLAIRDDGGTERLSLTNSGRVGIGTVVPAAELHVAGDTLLDGTLGVDGGTLSLENGLSNLIDFGSTGVGGPEEESPGWKLRLFDGAGANQDYGLGIESSTLWLASNSQFKFYIEDSSGGTYVNHMTLTETELTLDGDLNLDGDLDLDGDLIIDRAIKQDHYTSLHDVWIQGGDTDIIGDNRNLAIVGWDEDSGDKLVLNYGGEYAGGTQIDGDLSVDHVSADLVSLGSDRTPALCEFDIVAGNQDANMNEDLVIGAGDEMYFVVDGEAGCSAGASGNGSAFHWAAGEAPSTDVMSLTESGDLTIVGTASKPGGGSWSNSSDIRLKDVQGSYERGLSEIMELRAVRFRYKEDNPRGLPSDAEQIGFIAQEVRPIFPEAIDVGDDGYLNFNMHPLNVAAVNAIQELEAEKEASDSARDERLARLEERMRYEESALRTELADVKIRMAKVLKRLNALEAQIGVASSP